MNIKTAGLITLVWIILQSLFLLIISLDAGSFEVLTKRRVLSTGVSFLIWNTLTIILYKLIKKSVINRNYLLLTIIFIAVYIVFQPILTTLVNLIPHYIKGKPLESIVYIFTNTPFIAYYISFIQYIFVFFMCLGLIHIKNSNQMKLTSIALEKKAATAELNLSEMKMQVLKTQLSPHFLFNSLNSISGLIRNSKSNESLDAVASLGDLLRYSLNASNNSFISLAEEVEFTNHYVDLQRLRFQDFFTLKLDCNSSLNHLMCPPFLLQTLIENAFTHAVVNKKSVIQILAKIYKSGKYLKFEIKNTFPSNEDPVENGIGLALQNLTERLNLLYHGNFKIEQYVQQETYISSVQIPLSKKIYDTST